MLLVAFLTVYPFPAVVVAVVALLVEGLCMATALMIVAETGITSLIDTLITPSAALPCLRGWRNTIIVIVLGIRLITFDTLILCWFLIIHRNSLI